MGVKIGEMIDRFIYRMDRMKGYWIGLICGMAGWLPPEIYVIWYVLSSIAHMPPPPDYNINLIIYMMGLGYIIGSIAFLSRRDINIVYGLASTTPANLSILISTIPNTDPIMNIATFTFSWVAFFMSIKWMWEASGE